MQPLRWTAGHQVFQAEFDAEHRELFRLAEDLRHTVEDGGDHEAVRQAVDRLAAEIEAHFAHEERQMRACGYSAYAWHKRQHDGIRHRAKIVLKQFAKGDREALLKLVEHIAEWLQGHTGLTDRMLGAYLRNYERQHTALAS